MNHSDKQALMIVGILVMGVYAAYCQKWEFAGGIVTGIFALLNLDFKKEQNGV